MMHCNIPVFVPHMGCPHDCVFCSQRKITGTDTQITAESARIIIDEQLRTVESSEYTEIAFFGGSFTGIPKTERRAFLSLGNEYINRGLADGIRLSTRPDYINIEILHELLSYGVTAIELGVQSMNDEVLTLSGRGHSSEAVIRAVRLIREFPFELGLQMMTGLPGDTPDISVETARRIASLAPDTVRVYPTLVIRGTRLEELMRSGEYQPWSVDKTVSTLVRIRKIFDESHIKIIRMGLQTTDEISPNASVVGGPFHPAIGELVDSELFYERLLEKVGERKNCAVTVTCSNRDVSRVIGHKSINRKRLINERGINMRVQTSKTANFGEIEVIEVKDDCF